MKFSVRRNYNMWLIMDPLGVMDVDFTSDAKRNQKMAMVTQKLLF